MKRSRLFCRMVLTVFTLSFSIFAASLPIEPVQTYPYAFVAPTSPTPKDSVVMQLIVGNNSNNCVSPFISSFHIIPIPIECFVAPCPQQYMIKIGYAPDLKIVGRVCPMIVGPYGPTYRFGVLDVGTYTVVDTMAGKDTLLSFTVSEKNSPIVSITGKVTKWNSLIYDSGPLVSGAKVYLESPKYLALRSSLTDAIIAPVPSFSIIDSAVTDNSGGYSFAGHVIGTYLVAISAVGYQNYSTPGMVLRKDTLLHTILLPVNATGGLNGTVSSYASCHYVNNVPLCTGLLAPITGCSVTVTFPPIIMYALAKNAAAILPAKLTAVTDNSGHYSFPSIPITYDNQPITVTASKSGYNQKRASVSLITTPSAIQNFSLESGYSNSNTIEKNGMRYTIATNKASYNVMDSIFARYTVENLSAAPVTFSFGSGCQYDMNVVKPPFDTLYHYLKGVGCITMVTEITLQPNQTAVKDFPGWKSDAIFDSLRISAMLAGLTQTTASIDIRFEPLVTGINFNTRAGVSSFKNAIIAFDRLSNTLKLSIPSTQSIQLEVYGLDGRKIADLLNKEQCGPGIYRLSLNKIMVTGCMVAKLKTATAVSFAPITFLR